MKGISILGGAAFALLIALGGCRSAAPGDGRFPGEPEGGFVSFFERVRHLIAGDDARQRDVDEGSIDPERVIRVFGYVRDPEGAPLSGARVDLLDLPSFGYTESREDGRFDLLAHAATRLVVRVRREGFLESHRHLRPSRPHEHVLAADVVLVPRDAVVTTVRAGEATVARGSQVDDGDGPRQATLLFPSGLTARARRADGMYVPLPTLSVRATEYTVGALGPSRMPAPMPRQIAYTYAVEVSVDEADALEATSVELDRPVPFYLENFVGMPVGGVVPSGYYDRERAEWIASADGRVVALVGRSAGLASLDVDGDGVADDPAALARLGIDDEERRALVDLYADGAELWRVPVRHFTPYDYNWPYRPPAGARGSSLAPTADRDETPCGSEAAGSIIDCENQGLAEELSVLGTGHRLRHSSEWAPGNRDAFRVRVPLGRLDDIQPTLRRIDVRSVIEGQVHEASRGWEGYETRGDALFFEYVWDGRDADGRRLHQPATAWNEVCYVYDGVLASLAPDETTDPSFGSFASEGVFVAVERNGTEVYLCRTASAEVGVWDIRSTGFLGLSLDAFSALDLERGQVRAGVGGRLSTRTHRRGYHHFAGYVSREELPRAYEEGVAANEVGLRARALMVDGDSRVVVLSDAHGVWRIEHDRTLSAWPGTRDLDLDALNGGAGITLGNDGNLYLLEDRGRLETAATLSRITPTGERTVLAGGSTDAECCGSGGCGSIRPERLGDGGDPREACLSAPPSHRLAVMADGSLLFIHDRAAGMRADGARLRRLGPDGGLSTVLVATETDVRDESGRVLGHVDRFSDGPWASPDGRVWLVGATSRFSERVGDRTVDGTVLLELREDGLLYALTSFEDTCEGARRPHWRERWGTPLAEGCLFDLDLRHVAWGPDGHAYLHVAGTLHAVIEGRLHHIAGRSDSVTRRAVPHGPDEPLDLLPLDARRSFVVLAAGPLIVSDYFFDFDLGPVASDFGPLYLVGSRAERFEDDGIHLSLGGLDYVFGRGGQPLRTTSRLVPGAVTRFEYARAPDGMPGVAGEVLSALIDPEGNSLRIERPSARHVVLTAPFGEQTHLHDDDGDGYADRVRYEGDPSGGEISLVIGSGRDEGLLQAMIDRTGARHEYRYDEGRLVRDERVGVGAQTLAASLPRHLGGQRSLSVLRTSAEGRPTRYDLTDHEPASFFEGRLDRRVTYPDGTFASWTRSADRAWAATTDSSGLVSTSRFAADPFGDVGAFVLVGGTTETPAGRRVELSTTREVRVRQDASRTVEAWQETATVAPGTPLEARASRVFDPVARTWTMTSPEGRIARATLDEQGRLINVEPPGRHPVTFQYDARGRVNRISRGVGGEARSTTLAYPASGRQPERIEGSDGRSVVPSYDPLGRVQAVQDASGNTRFGYAEASRSATFAGPDGADHTLRYDLLGGLASYEPPPAGGATDGGEPWRFMRDADGQLRAATLGDGRSVHVEVDGFGRPVALRLSRGTATLTYDPATGALDTLTMPTADGARAVGLALEHDGPLLLGQTWTGAIVGEVRVEVDARWQLASLTVGGAPPVAYVYDRDGLVVQAGPLVIERDPNAGTPRATQVARTTTALEVDGFGAPVVRTASWPGGDFTEELREHDRAGRIVTQVEREGAAQTTTRYEYDAVGRLARSLRDGEVVAEYEHDARGNRVAWRDARGAATATYDAQDRLLRVEGALTRELEHDGHGRVTAWRDAAGRTALRYDELGNLLDVTRPDGRVIGYEVDPFGRRVQRTVDGGLDRGWLYQGGRPVAELDRGGAIHAVFVYATHATTPELMLAGGRIYRLVVDHLGSVRRVVDAETGEVAQALDYDPYGRVLRDTRPGFQPFGFAGGLYDPDTELIRFGARDYDPSIGRWLAKDPALLTGGDTNLYAYVGGDPINLVDPAGLDWHDYFDTSHDGWLQRTAEVIAGFGDFISMGATKWVRTHFYGGDPVNPCSGAYTVGTVSGVVFGLLPVAAGVRTAGTAARHASGGARVASVGGDIAPATTVREIGHGERVRELVEEVARLTYESGGLEHAIISTQTGQRLIVQGGRGGIEFAADLRRVILHTHPSPTGPSMADFTMLQQTGQRSSWLYELFGGGLSRFRSR